MTLHSSPNFEKVDLMSANVTFPDRRLTTSEHALEMSGLELVGLKQFAALGDDECCCEEELVKFEAGRIWCTKIACGGKKDPLIPVLKLSEGEE